LLIYIFRSFIIATVFSAAFLPMEKLFFWQLIGDVLKIASWLIAYVMLSKAMTKIFILTEVFFSLSFVVLTFYLTQVFGIVGAVISYAVNYALYMMAVTVFVIRKID